MSEVRNAILHDRSALDQYLGNLLLIGCIPPFYSNFIFCEIESKTFSILTKKTEQKNMRSQSKVLASRQKQRFIGALRPGIEKRAIKKRNIGDM